MDWDNIDRKLDKVPGWILYPAITLVAIFILNLCTLLYNICGVVDKGEYLRETVELEDGSTIDIIHSWSCVDKCLDKETGRPKMQWFESMGEIAEFTKSKCDVYDYCISAAEASMFDAVSQRNLDVKDEYEGLSREDSMYYDFSDRTYRIYYSYKDGKMMRLTSGKDRVANYK